MSAPVRMVAVAESGRYIPTANGNARTPTNSMMSATTAPMSRSRHRMQ